MDERSEKGINGVGIYDENPKNSRVKIKFINPFHDFKNLKTEKKIKLF